MSTEVADPLRLIALDPDDLAIVSAHLQDAVAKVGDIAYLPREKRFAMLINRFDWPAADRGEWVRRRAGVHFDRVLAARVRGFDLADRETVLNLLAVEFAEKAAPSGLVTLFFSGDAAIQLDVECLEAALSDLGPAWSVSNEPRHEAS